jgi:excisionase family DNA binding protein
MEPPYTVDQTATALNLSKACIRAWIAQGRIAYLRLGRAIRIPASEIQRLLDHGTVPEREQRRNPR